MKLKIAVFVLLIWIAVVNTAHHFAPELSSTSILLGTIAFQNTPDKTLTFPVLYNGNEYDALIEVKGETRSAHYELYDPDCPSTLYILIAEDLAKPKTASVKNFSTSANHPYRLFKLSLHTPDQVEDNAQWIIEEVANTEKIISIPDNTIILLGMNPDSIAELTTQSWPKQSNIIMLPTIKLHNLETLSWVVSLEDLAAKMKLAIVDFRFFHSKLDKKSRSFSNNRILSIPAATSKRLRI